VNFSRVNRVAQIVAGAVGDERNQAFRLTQLF
jgi:hypothetical protein